MTDVAHLYKLTSPSGKVYIGVAKNTKKRWQEHACSAKNGSSCAIHKAMRKYGFDAFKKEVLVTSTFSFVKELEVKAIAAYNTLAPFGYNLTDGGDGTNGYTHTQEARRRISSSQKGRAFSEEHKAKLSKANAGKIHSEEHKRKIGAASSATPRTAAWKEAIGAALRGKTRTPEQRAARAENQRLMWADPEYRASMMAARAAKKKD